MSNNQLPDTGAGLCIVGLHTADIASTLAGSLKSFQILHKRGWKLYFLPYATFSMGDLAAGLKWLLQQEDNAKYILLLGHGKEPTVTDGKGVEHTKLKAHDTGALLYIDSGTRKSATLTGAALLDSIASLGCSSAIITIRPYNCHNYAWDNDLKNYKLQQRQTGSAIVNVDSTTISGRDLLNQLLLERRDGGSSSGPREVTTGDTQKGHHNLYQDV